MRNERSAASRLEPAHDLAEIKRRIAADNFHPSTTKATDLVIREYGGSKRDARRMIQRIVATLGEGDYAGTRQMFDGALADEYGTMYDELGWYVKLTFNVQDDEVDVISCHLTKWPLQTRDRTIDAFDPPPHPR